MNSTRRTNSMWRLTMVMLLVLLGACGIEEDSSPRDIPLDGGVAAPGAAVGGDASGANRIYLVGPGDSELLRSVPRDAVSRQNLIEILFLGPNEAELSQQYFSRIPSGTRLLTTRSQGNVFFIDVSEELIGLTGGALTQALAQIVYTASELEGVDAVQLTVEGEAQSWPKGNGDFTSGSLQIYDYPGFVQSAQPDYPALAATG